MEKKIASGLAILMLSVMLLAPYMPWSSADTPVPSGPLHDVVVWLESNRGANLFTAAKVDLTGYLTNDSVKIDGTDFHLTTPGNWCYVDTAAFKNLTVVPNDVTFTLYIDWNYDGTWDSPYNPLTLTNEPIDLTVPGNKTEFSYASGGRTVTIEIFLGQQHHYWTMTSDPRIFDVQIGELAPVHMEMIATPLMPNYWDIFSCPDPVTGIVKIVVPENTFYVEPDYFFLEGYGWFRLIIPLVRNGYGWIFTLSGSAPVAGDVDCYTYVNETGSYWDAPGDPKGFNDELAAPPGEFPDTGPDGIPGTADDGAGDGTTDPKGSSCLNLYEVVDANLASSLPPPSQTFADFVDWYLTVVFTTANTTCTIDAPASDLHGISRKDKGKPWEFVHSGVTWDDTEKADYANAIVSYVMAWGVIDTTCMFGGQPTPFDIVVKHEDRLVRKDCMIPDLSISTELWVYVDDLRRVSKAYDTRIQDLGEDDTPNTADDKKEADALWDNGADCAPWPGRNGWVYIEDLRRVSKDYDKKLTSSGIG